MNEAVAATRNDDVLRALRHATARHHASIEALIALDSFNDLRSYVRILRAFDALLRVWEPAIVAAAPTHLRDWIRAGSRRQWLAQDRRQLDDAHEVALTPEVIALVRTLTCNSAVFGSLYVIEGSTLGGQVISRRIAERLALEPATGAAFFHGHGKATGRRWQEFQRELADAAPRDVESVRRACEAACGTFDALATQLRACLFEGLGDASDA